MVYNVKLLLRWSEFVGVNQIETILFGEEEKTRRGGETGSRSCEAKGRSSIVAKAVVAA